MTMKDVGMKEGTNADIKVNVKAENNFDRQKAGWCSGKKMSVEDKRQQEKETVSQMIALYCRKKHGTKGALCPDCASLDAYARLRSDKCPFMETKTFCSNCKVHCYKKEMREKIREVMRFSGPQMIFVHPVMAIRHVIESKKEKRRLEKSQ